LNNNYVQPYKHYVNRLAPTDSAFVTTTVLDFVPVFADPGVADLAVKELFAAHETESAPLHSFVVMRHHIHFLCQLPDHLDVSAFVRRVKSKMARSIRPLLSPKREAGFDQQRGLNDRVFWQRSFRCFGISSVEVFRQKVTYVHWNPVKAEVCGAPEEYRWSSACIWHAGLWDEVKGVSLADWERCRPNQ
jgi:putative transposase